MTLTLYILIGLIVMFVAANYAGRNMMLPAAVTPTVTMTPDQFALYKRLMDGVLSEFGLVIATIERNNGMITGQVQFPPMSVGRFWTLTRKSAIPIVRYKIGKRRYAP